MRNEEKLNKVIKASGNTVESYWPGLFAKALKGQDITALLASVGSAPAAGGAGPAAASEADAPAAKEEASKYWRFCLRDDVFDMRLLMVVFLFACNRGGRARRGCRHGRSFRWWRRRLLKKEWSFEWSRRGQPQCHPSQKEIHSDFDAVRARLSPFFALLLILL